MRVVTVARKPCEGSITGSVLAHGTGALCIEACRIATTENLDGGAYSSGGRRALPGDERTGAAAGMFEEGRGRLPGQYEQPAGRWPSNVLLQGAEVARQLDAQSGTTTSGPLRPVDATNWKSKPFDDGRGWNSHAMHGTGQVAPQGYGDTGGASRYFKQVGR